MASDYLYIGYYVFIHWLFIHWLLFIGYLYIGNVLFIGYLYIGNVFIHWLFQALPYLQDVCLLTWQWIL